MMVKNRLSKGLYLWFYLSTLSVVVLCGGCTWQQRIIHEYDEVKEVQRTTGRFYYRFSHNSFTPLYGLEQLLLVEKKRNNYTYTFFDKLASSSATFDIEDSVYLLVDDSIMPLSIKHRFNHTKESLTTDEETILAADSTEVTVVTGYAKTSTYYSNISYQVPQKFMESILTAKKVQFRYYSGPHMLTAEPNYSQLIRMKKVIDYK